MAAFSLGSLRMSSGIVVTARRGRRIEGFAATGDSQYGVFYSWIMRAPCTALPASSMLFAVVLSVMLARRVSAAFLPINRFRGCLGAAVESGARSVAGSGVGDILEILWEADGGADVCGGARTCGVVCLNSAPASQPAHDDSSPLVLATVSITSTTSSFN